MMEFINRVFSQTRGRISFNIWRVTYTYKLSTKRPFSSSHVLNMFVCTKLSIVSCFNLFYFLFVAGLEAQVQESSKDLYWF